MTATFVMDRLNEAFKGVTEKWDEAIDPSLRVQDELPKTSKFTKKAGLKREINSAGWTKDGVHC